MKENMIRYIQKHQLVSPGDKIVVGVSGGADSVCLLHLLNECQREWKLSLFVVHIHHGIRGAEAAGDARFVEELAEQLSLPFFLVEGDVPVMAKETGMSEEEAGRKFRYEELERIRREQKADHIAVAHHRDDQAETVLFRLFRGTGVRGLAGMAPARGAVIRPLLFAGRQEIRDYLRQQGLAWREDSTNENTVYSRNWIRRVLLPQVTEQINAQTAQHIAETASDAARWKDFVGRISRQAAKEVLAQQKGQEILVLAPFFQQDEVIQDELLRLFLDRGMPGVKDVSRLHYEQLRQLAYQEPGKRLDLPQGIVVRREYDCIRLYEGGQDEPESVYMECRIPSVNIVEMDGEMYQIAIEVRNREELVGEIPQKDYTKWFDYDRIKNNLVLRNAEEGDFFVLDQWGHKKKLARYYMDQKIPKKQRKSQLVLADGSHVMWAFPGRMSEAYKINKNTTRVLVATKERIRHEGRDHGIDSGRENCCQGKGTGGAD